MLQILVRHSASSFYIDRSLLCCHGAVVATHQIFAPNPRIRMTAAVPHPREVCLAARRRP